MDGIIIITTNHSTKKRTTIRHIDELIGNIIINKILSNDKNK